MSVYDLTPLTERLAALADADYAEFHRRLIPGADCRLYGVRMPTLRAIAKELAAGDWRGFLEASRDHSIYEIRMLHGLVLGGAKCPVEEKLALTEAFLPHIENWAVCDSFCSTFKPRAAEREAVFDYVRACAASEPEYRARFGLVMLMNRFHDEPWLRGTMAVYRAFRHDAHYARMAAAWGLATLWPAAREECLAILEEHLWDEFTHNRAIQKLCESYRVSDDDKALARSLKR